MTLSTLNNGDPLLDFRNRINLLGTRTRIVNAVKDFGLVAGGTAAANRTALDNAFNAAEDGDYELVIPAGTYAVDNSAGPLLWDYDNTIRISGMGAGPAAQGTVIQFSNVDETGLHIVGKTDGGIASQGWLRDIRIEGPNSSAHRAGGIPHSGVAGILLDAVKFLEVRNVTSRYFDVGLDMVNNCFGTTFYSYVSRYATCNLALRFRSSLESGNDIPFFNCWLGGRDASISVEPDAGTGVDGLHMFGGQISLPGPTDTERDAYGGLMIGYDWEAEAATAGYAGRVCLYGTTFEGLNRAWAIRAYRGFNLHLHSVGFNGSYDELLPHLGVLKQETPHAQDFLLLNGCDMSNHWKEVFSSYTPTGTPQFNEIGTQGICTIDGDAIDLREEGFLNYSGWTRGVAIGGDQVSIAGLRLRNNAGTFEKSTDGSSWSAV